MAFDTIGKTDMTIGKTTGITLPSLKDEMARLPEAKRASYENFPDRTNGNPPPWAQRPRRMGTDKNADELWVGNSWGASMARIDTKTGQASIIPFPNLADQPYHIAVDPTPRRVACSPRYTPASPVPQGTVPEPCSGLRCGSPANRRPDRIAARGKRPWFPQSSTLIWTVRSLQVSSGRNSRGTTTSTNMLGSLSRSNTT
jgi:hypothetical protein